MIYQSYLPLRCIGPAAISIWNKIVEIVFFFSQLLLTVIKWHIESIYVPGQIVLWCPGVFRGDVGRTIWTLHNRPQKLRDWVGVIVVYLFIYSDNGTVRKERQIISNLTDIFNTIQFMQGTLHMKNNMLLCNIGDHIFFLHNKNVIGSSLRVESSDC